MRFALVPKNSSNPWSMGLSTISAAKSMPRLTSVDLIEVRQSGEVHAEVPFADRRGPVPVALEQRAQRRAVRADQWPVVAVENAWAHPRPPRVAPGEQPIARASAIGSRRMSVGKVRTRSGYAVDAGSGHGRVRVIRLDVAPAHVIGKDEHDVGTRALCQ